ncbi:MAG: hypothetical protein ACI4Q3_07430 [Kiritimatiellia bacterium]
MRRRTFLESALGFGVGPLVGARAFAAAARGEAPKTVVLGGGAFALGHALARPGEVLVLERGIHLAADYGMVGDYAAPGNATTDLGRDLRTELARAGLLKADRLELPPLSDFMAAFFAARGGRAFMNVELAALARDGEGWSGEVFGGGTEGFVPFRAAAFLDTTATGWRDVGLADVAERTFSGITEGGLFTVRLPPAADAHLARLKLHDDAAAAGATLLAETNALGVRYVRRPADGRVIVRTTPQGTTWVPSAQFPDFITAFEEGLKWTSM